MKRIDYPPRDTWPALCRRPVLDLETIEAQVLPVLREVQREGDAAIRRFAAQFDHVVLEELMVPSEEIEHAADELPETLKNAIALARQNIEAFHRVQLAAEPAIDVAPGVRCWRKSVPVSRVGLYIPGGTAPLFSTVLMLGIPARLAGCREVVLCTPPDRTGRVHPAILYCASRLGIEKIFKIGGAQAVAALAFGTETVPGVDKIFGPGNQYVTTAKQLVSRAGVAIDLPAGPTELAVVADKSCTPAFVAADVLSQAEHGEDSQVVLVSPETTVLDAVQAQIDRQLGPLPRRDIATAALQQSKSILVDNLDIALDFVNTYAPEHLILAIDAAEKFAGRIESAGSVFLGHFAPESAGDYASGTNHTLPTNGSARTFSGVSVDSFVKKITFQQITEAGLRHIGPAIQEMARAEGLEAHRNAVTVRTATGHES